MFVYHTSLLFKSPFYEHKGGLTSHASKLARIDPLDLEQPPYTFIVIDGDVFWINVCSALRSGPKGEGTK